MFFFFFYPGIEITKTLKYVLELPIITYIYIYNTYIKYLVIL